MMYNWLNSKINHPGDQETEEQCYRAFYNLVWEVICYILLTVKSSPDSMEKKCIYKIVNIRRGDSLGAHWRLPTTISMGDSPGIGLKH